MRKMLAMLVAAALLASAAPVALSERAPLTLEGFVTELVEDGFVMEDRLLGAVLLNVDEYTALDGVLADGAIEVGQYVFVEYDGRLTRSLPPQAHADKVGCYVLEGVAGEAVEGGVLLRGDPVFGDVLVRLDMARDHVFLGAPLTVYYNGVMALSLPGQVGASAVVVPALEGTAGDVDDGGLTLTADDGAKYRVEWDENTIFGALAAGEADALTDGQGISADGESGEADAPAPVDGDRVRVYFGGDYLSDERDAVLALEAIVLKP